jgi:hypothetical protein
MPSSWGAWWSLAYLDLRMNFLSGPLPSSPPASGNQLEYMDLGNNRFTGSPPSGEFNQLYYP